MFVTVSRSGLPTKRPASTTLVVSTPVSQLYKLKYIPVLPSMCSVQKSPRGAVSHPGVSSAQRRAHTLGVGRGGRGRRRRRSRVELLNPLDDRFNLLLDLRRHGDQLFDDGDDGTG